MPTLFFWIVTSIDSIMERLTAEWQLMLLFIIVMAVASCVDVRPIDRNPLHRLTRSYNDARMQLPTYSPPLSPKSEASARAFAFRRASGPEMSTSRGWIHSIIYSMFNSDDDRSGPQFSDPFHPGNEFHRFARASYPIPPFRNGQHLSKASPPSTSSSATFPSTSTWSCFTPGYLKFDGDLIRRSKSFPAGDMDRAWVMRQVAGPDAGTMGTGMRGRKRSKKYEIRKLAHKLTTVEEDRIMEEVEATTES